MATITLEKSLLNEMSHIMGNEDLMEQTIKFVCSIRRKAKAKAKEDATQAFEDFVSSR